MTIWFSASCSLKPRRRHQTRVGEIKHKSRPSNENGWQVSTKSFRDRKKYAADWTLRAAAVMAASARSAAAERPGSTSLRSQLLAHRRTRLEPIEFLLAGFPKEVGNRRTARCDPKRCRFKANAAVPEGALERRVTGRCRHGTVDAASLRRKR